MMGLGCLSLAASAGGCHNQREMISVFTRRTEKETGAHKPSRASDGQ
jgi:hypothetical protein